MISHNLARSEKAGLASGGILRNQICHKKGSTDRTGKEAQRAKERVTIL